MFENLGLESLGHGNENIRSVILSKLAEIDNPLIKPPIDEVETAIPLSTERQFWTPGLLETLCKWMGGYDYVLYRPLSPYHIGLCPVIYPDDAADGTTAQYPRALHGNLYLEGSFLCDLVRSTFLAFRTVD